MKGWLRRRHGSGPKHDHAKETEIFPVDGNTAKVARGAGDVHGESLEHRAVDLRLVSNGDVSRPLHPGWEVTTIELDGLVQVQPDGPRVTRVGFLRAFIQGALLVCWMFNVSIAQDGSLWNEREGFRYTNRKAMQIGDLITVVVVESSSGSNRSSLSTSKEHKVNVDGGPGVGPLDFIPLFGVDANAKNELEGSGQVSVAGQLTTTITVEVREIRPNGYLVVEGSRLIDLNGEQEQVTLYGVARPEDIRSDNTVLSTKIAEMRINYSGKGAGKSASRPGILGRILGWIF